MNDLSSNIYIIYGVGAAAAYLLGSIPFGFLIARFKGVDIRTVGSKNIGATNVYRTLGKGPGLLTFALDFAKGLAATFIPMLWPYAFPCSLSYLTVVCAVAVVLGHSFPVWLGFKGGKGVATGAGILVGLAPLSAAFGLVTFIVVVALSRYVSLASMSAAIVVAVSKWVHFCGTSCVQCVSEEYPVAIVLTLLATLVIIRHRTNIARLLKGTENRFSFKRTQDAGCEGKDDSTQNK